ncbi:MAG: glycosyltransferase family 4 protein [Candidatus Binatia bacterium]
MKLSVGFYLGRPERSARLARDLAARGIDVAHYNRVDVAGEPVVHVGKGFARAVTRVLRTPHDVYCTGLTYVPSLALYANRRLRGKPYVFNATAAHWEMFRDRARKRRFASLFERRLHPFFLELTFAGASRIVCNSRFLEARIAERYPHHAERLSTVYNGIDFEKYAGGRRQSLIGVSPGDFVVLCVTTLNYGRKSAGLALVLQAFDLIRSAEPRAKLVIAAKSASPLYETWATELVRAKGLDGDVVVYFNHPSIQDLLASADLFVYATPNDSNDSLPRALIEAQTAGLAAVTTDTSGCPEIVRNGETGRVVPYRAEAMAEAMLTLMGDAETRRQMAQRAAIAVREVFSWDRMADSYATTFYEVSAMSPPAVRTVDLPRRSPRQRSAAA